MTAPVLTPNAMRLKFPMFFANQADADLQNAIDEASRKVDATIWTTGDYLVAWEYYAGHVMMCAIMFAASGTGQLITSERAGPMGVTYQGIPFNVDDLETTFFGRRYLELERGSNFPAVAVI